MPRLDAVRLQTWRSLSTLMAQMVREVDDDLVGEWDIPLGWFDVLAALAQFGGVARPVEVADALRVPASSLSRRLDRLEDEGWICRHHGMDPADGRAVRVELTRRGRNLWREMNLTYRRSVQTRFARHLADEEIEWLAQLADRLAGAQITRDDQLDSRAARSPGRARG